MLEILNQICKYLIINFLRGLGSLNQAVENNEEKTNITNNSSKIQTTTKESQIKVPKMKTQQNSSDSMPDYSEEIILPNSLKNKESRQSKGRARIDEGDSEPIWKIIIMKDPEVIEVKDIEIEGIMIVVNKIDTPSRYTIDIRNPSDQSGFRRDNRRDDYLEDEAFGQRRNFNGDYNRREPGSNNRRDYSDDRNSRRSYSNQNYERERLPKRDYNNYERENNYRNDRQNVRREFRQDSNYNTNSENRGSNYEENSRNNNFDAKRSQNYKRNDNISQKMDSSKKHSSPKGFANEVNPLLDENYDLKINLDELENQDKNKLTIAELKEKSQKKMTNNPDITKLGNIDKTNQKITFNKQPPSENIVDKDENEQMTAKSEEKKESTSSTKDKEDLPSELKDGKKDYLYGTHVVEVAIHFNYRKCLDLFVQMPYKENPSEAIKKISELAKSKGIKIKYLVKEKLDKFTGSRPHNGLVLKSEQRDYINISDFESFVNKFIAKPEGNLIVILDQIIDPQNFGSIIRSAVFLGADAIVANKNNKPPISASVAKVSSGASECVELFCLKSFKPFLGDAIAKNWKVVSTVIEKDHDIQMRLNNGNTNKEELIQQETNENDKKVNVSSQNISLTELNFNKTDNVILILGSEGTGITSNLKGVVNYNVYIPPLLNKEMVQQPPFNIIDSLNVGVSAGIIINHIKSQLNSFSDLEKNPTEENQNINTKVDSINKNIADNTNNLL